MSQGIRPMVRSAVFTLCLLVAVLVPAVAAAVGPAGTWQGRMRTADGGEFEVTLVLDGSGSRWTGSLTDPDSGEMPLQNLRVTATRVTFTFRPASGGVPAHFTGGYIAGDDRITGTFSVRGASRFVKFERTAEGEGAAEAALAAALPARVRHDYKFALTARAAYWPALHLIKDETRKINDVTKGTWNFDGTLRYYVLDSFCVLVRGYQGGLNFHDDVHGHDEIGVSGDTYLRLDGFEIGVTGYLGNIIMSESRFNPYLTGGAGRVSWELTESGRGSAPLVLDRSPLEGDDLSGFFGLGTEYEVSSKIALEFELIWRVFFTEDEKKWEDTFGTWSDTHAWSAAAGVTWGFY